MIKEITKAVILEIVFNVIFLVCIYFLWNWLMPNLIMAKKITFLEAWGLRTLAQFCTYRMNYSKK